MCCARISRTVSAWRASAFSASTKKTKADYALFEGTCIGNKHICELEDPFAVQNPLTGHTNKKLSGVRVQITAARDEVFMREIYITKGKSVCEQK